MKMIPVQSSHLKSIGWAENLLEIEFKDGRRYRYAAPEGVFVGLLRAESKGKFFDFYIKDQYHGERVG